MPESTAATVGDLAESAGELIDTSFSLMTTLFSPMKLWVSQSLAFNIMVCDTVASTAGQMSTAMKTLKASVDSFGGANGS